MRILGILGGVASGKSFVTNHLAQLGAAVLDADRAGHEALKCLSVEKAARDRWGDRIFGEDGRIDRSRLAAIVFAPPPDGPREREYLESLTHPEIGRRLRHEARRLEASGVRVAILDAALLLEAGWSELCDKLIFVDTPRQQRLARALARGWTEEEFAAREAAQESLDWKRTRADVVVDNSGPPEETKAQLERLWRCLTD